jgi:DNA-binding response OmpR family regulator
LKAHENRRQLETDRMSVAAHKWSYVFDAPTRILVVDDDPILHEFASVYLTTPLSQVVTAAGGAAALDLLSRETFDVALFDIEMPDMDGFELLERVRAQEKLRDLPVIIVTGREDIASIDRAYAAGATSFTTKPINWRQLSYQLRYVIRASRSEAGAPRPRDDGGAAVNPMTAAPVAMPPATRRQFATTLSSIINTAKQMAAGHTQGREAAQARAIAAAAEVLLRKFLRTGEGAEAHSPAVVPLDRRRLASGAS